MGESGAGPVCHGRRPSAHARPSRRDDQDRGVATPKTTTPSGQKLGFMFLARGDAVVLVGAHACNAPLEVRTSCPLWRSPASSSWFILGRGGGEGDARSRAYRCVTEESIFLRFCLPHTQRVALRWSCYGWGWWESGGSGGFGGYIIDVFNRAATPTSTPQEPSPPPTPSAICVHQRHTVGE